MQKEDIEAQNVCPVEAQPYNPPPYTIAQPQPTVIYVTEMPVSSSMMVMEVEDPHPSLTLCAIIGFIFSWIPIVGFITFCVNSMNTPVNSMNIYIHSLSL